MVGAVWGGECGAGDGAVWGCAVVSNQRCTIIRI